MAVAAVAAAAVVGGGGGQVLLSADGSSVYFAGTAYDKNPNEVGPKSFIDKVAIKTGEKQRIYEGDNNGVFERVSTVLDINTGRYIVSRESPTEVGQQYLVQNGQRTQLTQNQDYTPDITRAPTERFVVTRPDGFKFRVTVTLPQNYQTPARASRRCSGSIRGSSRIRSRTTGPTGRSTRTASRTSGCGRWSSSSASATRGRARLADRRPGRGR